MASPHSRELAYDLLRDDSDDALSDDGSSGEEDDMLALDEPVLTVEDLAAARRRAADGGVAGGVAGGGGAAASSAVAAARPVAAASSAGSAWAYATMLTNDDFYPGVQTLAYSLLRSGTALPLVVIVTAEVSAHVRAQLEARKCIVVEVEAIPNPNEEVHVEGWVSSGYTKLALWSLTDWDKLVYIDADAMVVRNVDDLFLRPTPAAAPDVFPPDCFNAGVLVVTPNAATFASMLAVTAELPSHDGGDTGFLNSFFPDWWSWPAEQRLPFGYNAQRTMYWFTHKKPSYWAAVKPLSIIHYSSSPKPWDAAASKGELELRWWAMFVSAQLSGSGGDDGEHGPADIIAEMLGV
eukprot:PLAT2954.1.p1 GENE.PLAT2954.1~~PLAT2954.1.p1  ORF type:complete len:351 (+),score=162.19 PLAT2954.1:48-1100(+)